MSSDEIKKNPKDDSTRDISQISKEDEDEKD